jgi:glutamate-1-semialdehyde 2,1-aminomutase
VELTDGVQVDDFLCNYTASPHGHAHPDLVSAAVRGLGLGAPFGLPTHWETDMAETIGRRFNPMEQVRFTNSGSEATLQAVRVARACTGRPLVAKAEGGYHGSHDQLDISVRTFDTPECIPRSETRGTPSEITRTVIVFPFNDLARALSILDEHSTQLATVIIEPMLNSAGAIVAEPGFLEGLSAWCSANDVLLTVDEIATFRLSFGGLHSEYGMEPHLMCLGKGIGGGFAIGAIGGLERIMSEYDPRRSDRIGHAGTFNGNPVTMITGLTALHLLDEPTIARMNNLGQQVTDGVREIGSRLGLPLTASGRGSIGNVHFSSSPPRDAREAARLPKEPLRALYWMLLERGILIAPRGMYTISSVTEVEQVARFLEAVASCARECVGHLRSD